MGKTNIAELLKDCPKGMELDCTICNNVVTLEGVDTVGYYPIRVMSKDGFHHILTSEGCVYKREDAKCVIFPKGKTTWEGFVPPCQFKDGDVVISVFGDIHILRTEDSSYCAYRMRWTGASKLDSTISTGVEVTRLATEEEKQILFDSIKANGYKWNEKTKTLEKLINKNKFVIGAIVTNGKIKGKICLRDGDSYVLEDNTHIFFNEVHNWELVPTKFNINILKPFDKVLVRHNDDNKWCASFFSHIDKDLHSHCFKFVTIAGKSYPKMIPYECNEHLLGTNNDCSDYYKTW